MTTTLRTFRLALIITVIVIAGCLRWDDIDCMSVVSECVNMDTY